MLSSRSVRVKLANFLSTFEKKISASFASMRKKRIVTTAFRYGDDVRLKELMISLMNHIVVFLDGK
jgi:hypothetical protein